MRVKVCHEEQTTTAAAAAAALPAGSTQTNEETLSACSTTERCVEEGLTTATALNALNTCRARANQLS